MWHCEEQGGHICFNIDDYRPHSLEGGTWKVPVTSPTPTSIPLPKVTAWTGSHLRKLFKKCDGDAEV